MTTQTDSDVAVGTQPQVLSYSQGLGSASYLLTNCPLEWVSNLARGANIIVWAIALNIILGFVVGAASQSRVSIVGHVLSVFMSCLTAAGEWLLTAPDPGGGGEYSYGKARKLVRIGAVVAVIQSVLAAGLALSSLSDGVLVLFVAINIGLMLVNVAGTLAMLYYLSKLGLRIPDQKIVSRARVVLLGYSICMPAVGVTAALALYYTSQGLNPINVDGGPIIMLVAGAAGVALLVFGILHLMLMVRTRRLLAAAVTAIRNYGLSAQQSAPFATRRTANSTFDQQ